ncbi:hypothetical protein [Gracilinema caldarium]|uniref:Uncharacterized protein n=1 Tax=Gracilinema caldarium (strain ATCC 51460 / DSM 7334 / H1) TaxID=744872 RepID=F8F0V1_GRAC1|nr:hypothetical protein [Gracilinema caldarium]AEJ20237.1 hypothetical protein Spica_2112 [Gracilinema caldarium DSM 7334]
MVPGLLEYQTDKKRFEQSLLISILIWVLLMSILAFLPIRPYQLSDTSLNPVYINLVSPTTTVQEQLSEAEPSRTAGSRKSVTARAPASVASDHAITVPFSESVAGGSSTSRISPAPRASNPYQGRGGEDPFAPLSEADLAIDSPEAPALPSGLAQDAGLATANGNPVGSAQTPHPDALARRVQSTTQALSEQNEDRSRTIGSQPGGTESGSVIFRGTSTGTALVSGGAEGNLQGSFDFGDGPGRRLISAPQAVIPAKLLEGQPTLLETMVRFRIDKGGTVIALSIQFDPPLPLDIAEYLKTYVFSRWVFSSSNSDGQVRFKYSIKVQ